MQGRPPGRFPRSSLGPEPCQAVTRRAFRLFIFGHGVGAIELLLFAPKLHFFRAFRHVLPRNVAVRAGDRRVALGGLTGCRVPRNYLLGSSAK